MVRTPNVGTRFARANDQTCSLKCKSHFCSFKRKFLFCMDTSDFLALNEKDFFWGWYRFQNMLVIKCLNYTFIKLKIGEQIFGIRCDFCPGNSLMSLGCSLISKRCSLMSLKMFKQRGLQGKLREQVFWKNIQISVRFYSPSGRNGEDAFFFIFDFQILENLVVLARN